MGQLARRLRRHEPLATVDRAALQARRVWMLGSPRSGTTWLLGLLGSFDQVHAIDEPNLGAYLGQFVCDVPGFDLDGIDSTNFTTHHVHRRQAQHFLSDAHREAWQPGLGRLIDDRFRFVAPREKLVVIKDPSSSQSAELIMSLQPRARLLYVLRDGRDVVDSVLAAMARGSWIEALFPGYVGLTEEDRLPVARREAAKWLWRTEALEAAYAAHAGPKLLVRYEELRADPVAGLRRITDWLGLPTSTERLTEVVDAHAFERLEASATGERSFVRVATPGNWRRSLRPAEQAVVEEVLGDKLAALGYPPADGDLTPSVPPAT